MKIRILIALIALVGAKAFCQTLNKAEYFFDADPGPGGGTPLSISPAATINSNFAVNISALTTGFHNLNIRFRDNTGKWSHFQSRTFYLAPLASLTPPGVNLTKAEYFIDADPGLGAGVNILITPASSINQNIVVPISSLSTGFHNLNFRVRDDKGKWAHFASRTFYILPPLSSNNSTSVTKAEYFFDSDPGVGLGNSIPVTPAAALNQNITIPVASLTIGFHTLNVRVRDDKGRWSHFSSRTFYILPPPVATAANLKRVEYFFDTDPGVGMATSLPITAGSPLTNNFAIDINSLSPGFHQLGIRYQDNKNVWSHFAVRTLYILPGNLLGATNLVRVEYFVDVDPEVNPTATGIAIPITPAASIDQTFALDLSGTAQGIHTLYIRAKDDKGFISTRVSSSFTILACTPPAAPTATGGTRCNEGTVVLNATSGVNTGQVYRWYADASSTTVLFTGAAFTTPSLNTTTDFFVSVFDPVTLCESNRVAVTAGIISTNPPVLNITGSVTICEGNSITLSAPIGFATYAWSNGEATREISVKTAGDYTVIVGNGTCQSNPSAPATIVVSTKPAKPSVTTSGTTNLCDGATVTLTAPAGFSYTWSSGEATQAITVSTSGNYSVVVANASNCASSPSDAIQVVATTTPTTPTVEIFGNTILCGTNTVGLLAPSGFSFYQWSSGETSQGITVSASGTYSVIVGNSATCLSPASTGVVVTATGQPCTTSGGTNAPPVIDTKPFAAIIEGKLAADLTTRISDPDNNLNFSSLRVINNVTSRGVAAAISSSFELEIDYANTPFTGVDRVTIEICDLAGACAQQVIDIEVVGEVEVFNGITPDGDGLNDFLLIKYLDVVEGASKNKVTILNRWGDAVFEIDDYDNLSRVFTGQTNSGSDLPSGTYFYRIDFAQGKSPINGFITLKR
jgi:gliding motility-associated-like protein